MFHPSSDTRKLGLWVYLFGSIGVLAKISTSASQPDISKIFPISPDLAKEVLVSGIMFFPTSYAILMFVSNMFSEYSYYRAKISRTELDEALGPGVAAAQSSGVAKVVVDQIIDSMLTANTLILMGGYIRNLVEIGLPIVFGTLCCAILYKDGIYTFVVIIHRSFRYVL